MTLKTSLIGGIAVVLWVAAPAFAQSPPAVESGTGEAREPAAAEGSSGFRLLEHGTGQRPPDSASPVPSKSEGGPVLLPHHYPPISHGGPSGFRRATYLPHVQAAEMRYALPPGLLDALVWIESRYNPVAVSKAGAAGLGQLMPGTARDLGVINRFDPVANLNGAANYLRQMLNKFGQVHLALAAYNAGPGAVERARGIPRNRETPAYVRNVLRHWRQS